MDPFFYDYDRLHCGYVTQVGLSYLRYRYLHLSNRYLLYLRNRYLLYLSNRYLHLSNRYLLEV